MKLEIIEPSGIKHAPYGHLQAGEVRVVSEQDGHFFCANGWAKHLPAEGEQLVPTGKRGSQDYKDPATWQPADADQPGQGKIQPVDGKLA